MIYFENRKNDFRQNIESDRIYDISEYQEFIRNSFSDIKKIGSNKKIFYYNMPNSFDIEVTSFTEYNSESNQLEKRASMYEWTLGLNGNVIIGRNWFEFFNLYDAIVERIMPDLNHRIIIYIHNLSYEFQFIRKWFEWSEVFSLDDREPVYAVTTDGIEFRCSYILSGYSLAKLADQLVKYKFNKMVGDLDYDIKRNSLTPLSEKEIKYCVNDVKVVMAYIKEIMERDGNIAKIPNTKTGYVRNYCRNMCLYTDKSHKKSDRFKYKKYRNLMQQLTLNVEEYKLLKEAFAGGFTHANYFYSNRLVKNVTSYDFTSSYPAVMCSEKFPMSRGLKVKITSKEQFEELLENYCCLFEAKFINISATTSYEHYLQKAKSWELAGETVDNGRIVEANILSTTITDIDFEIIQRMYEWEELKIGTFYIYEKAYLPPDLVKAVLYLYKDKTTLKDVEGMEAEYMNKKEMVNAAYGMMVTDIVRDEILYEENNEWKKEKPNIEEAIDKYNNSKKRFLSYPWGVWVTAYARRNLFTGIIEFGDDYIYSDTDSIKVLHINNHIDYINEYNEWVTEKLKYAMESNQIDFGMTRPKTIYGEEKPLGVWDFDGFYSRFKTLGAKRYMSYGKKGYSLTVAGLNKKVAMPYLIRIYFTTMAKNVIDKSIDVKTPFDLFTNELYIPSEYTGKKTHTYIDDEHKGILTDYLGNKCEYYEKSAINISPCEFTLSLSDEYLRFLRGARYVFG